MTLPESTVGAQQAAPLHDRVAVVTGVSRRKGIGFAIAQRLLTLGAKVFIQGFSIYDAQQPWGADADGVEGIAEELRALGRVSSMQADLGHPDSPRALVGMAAKQFGHVDIVVANHAYSTMGALEDLTVEQIDAHNAINVRGTLLLIQAFAAQHDGRAGGRVIMLTSGQHLGPMPGELAYIASKGALHQLTWSLSDHLVRRGITVNTVNPGATDTGYASPELYEMVKAASPQGRWGEPADAARVIGWLCTDDAAWLTGQVINSTGGGW